MVVSVARKYVLAACLAAISYLLMFLSFAVIPIVPYMKVDFSDLPVLLGMFLLGPFGGIEIALIRSVLYFLISGPSISNLIGVSTSFLATLAFCLPMYQIVQSEHFLKGKKVLLSIVVATLSLTFFLSLGNWLIITPLYMSVLGMKLSLPLNQLILFGVIPFNLIKGVSLSIAFWLVFSKLRYWLNDHSLITR
ncbi:ECF transporter S component [Liquorilactobacillus sicerae]|uniref:ECF transporter S component n=1 Tax=Liquorilactobacillus sicerae TaxID=1416943 RepID=UPI002480EB28|nr:ECF transporter S component [Liquorilactobacillus sicerae]